MDRRAEHAVDDPLAERDHEDPPQGVLPTVRQDVLVLMSVAALRGLILEEVLARLLQRSGYRLLTVPEDDPEALIKGSNGLRVRGRGADHQVDVLGELLLPTPFSLPMRLFVEAKFRAAPTGLSAVRNAVGLINDVNERYDAVGRSNVLPARRFEYRYALFSTSGFTANAQTFALAPQVSLIDLQGAAFEDLRGATSAAAARLLELAAREHLSALPTDQVRTALRLAFGTWQAAFDAVSDLTGRPNPTFNEAQTESAKAAEVKVGSESMLLQANALSVEAAKLEEDLTDDELILGFPHAPFVLALQPDDPNAFQAFLERAGPQAEVHLAFEGQSAESGEWVMLSVDGHDTVLARFGLPPLLEAWLLAMDERQSLRVRQVKREFLSTISVISNGHVTDLAFTPQVRQPYDVSTFTDPATTPLRRERRAPRAWTREVRGEESPIEEPWAGRADGPSWPESAVAELMRRLAIERPVQAEVLRAAAAAGGDLDRQRVYEIAHYAEDRTLRRFTLPVTRITKNLQAESLVASDVGPALRPMYPTPGPAKFFRVDPTVVHHIKMLQARGLLNGRET